MRYAIPPGDRQYSCWPALDELPALVAANLALKSNYAFRVLDVPYPLYARLCRDAAAHAAARFAQDASLAACALDRDPIIATGHQPELFHGGVWIKNFLVARLAAQLGGSPANLIVDSDVPKHLGLVVPVTDGGAVRGAEITFAQKQGQRAFEEYPPSFDRFDAFQRELYAAVETSFRHNAAEFVAKLRGSIGRGRNIGEAMALTRISYEREFGVANVEVPLSRLVEDPAYGAFVLSILAEAPRFAAAYNAGLARYRAAHRIRSRANPMSDLAVNGSRVETPFWVWRTGGERGRLYVETTGGRMTLYNNADAVTFLSAATWAEVPAAWRRIAEEGLKIRPRAIATTLFMRLFVCDLFVHGVGGAAYDEVTDAVVRAFYGVEPPAFATITATLTLPWPGRRLSLNRITALKRKLRDFAYNPQILIDGGAKSLQEVSVLIDERTHLVESAPADREGRRQKWERIRRINAALRARLSIAESAAAAELAEAQMSGAADQVRFGRDYSVFLVGARRAAEFYCAVLSRLAATAPPVRRDTAAPG